MDMAKYRDLFLSETREHLDQMGRLLIELEKQPEDGECLAALFRQAHSVKGMAASMGYAAMSELAHALEDLLDAGRQAGRLEPEQLDRLLAGCDLLESQLADVSAGGEPRSANDFLAADQVEELPAEALQPLEEEPAAPKPEAPVRTLVVEIAEHAVAPAARALLALKELERFGAIIRTEPGRQQLLGGEAVRRIEVALATGAEHERIEAALLAMADVVAVREAGAEEAAREDDLPRRRREDAERTVRIRTDLLDRLIRLTGELITTRTGLIGAWKEGRQQALEEGFDQLSLQVDELHYRVLQARMMPLATITGRLPRLVRDQARKAGKKVELRISGEDVELDRTIIEELSDPLVHMLRNAVDHGIESEGIVEVRAWREKDLVLIEVADNGRGIDPEAIPRRALERGLVDADRLDAMARRDLYALLCRPGFSTAEQVTETSGRGVGMDVVKAAVDGLGGDLEILSAPGEGTRILLRLPLSVAIIRILLVEVANMTLALPITRVIRTLEIERDQLQSSGRQLVLRLEEEVVPLLSMRKMLHQPPGGAGGTVSLVLVELQGRRVGLVVDRLLTQEEAFVQGLEFPLDRIPGLAGATLLGDGRVVFVIDPPGLVEAGRQGQARESA
ncbi:MAG: hypothetical protein Tsb0017_11730 [Geothermobacteraceae bacterium]